MSRDHPNPRLERPKTKAPSWGYQPDGRQQALLLSPTWPTTLHMPAQFDIADWGAWRALNNGVAAPHQQARIIEHLAMMTWFNADVFVPGDSHSSAYLAGKRSIMSQVDAILQFQPNSGSRGDGGEQG